MLPESGGMIEKKEKNETSTPAERYPKVSYTIEYYTDPYQTRPEAKFYNSGTFIHEAKNNFFRDPVPSRADPDLHKIRLLGPT